MINFYPDITLYRGKIKKRNFLLKIQTEVLYLFVKALFSPFVEKYLWKITLDFALRKTHKPT